MQFTQPKPHVIGFLTSMLLIAGIAEVVTPATADGPQAITVDAVAQGDPVVAASDAPGPVRPGSTVAADSGTDDVTEDAADEGGPDGTTDASRPGSSPTGGTTTSGPATTGGSTGGTSSGGSPSTGTPAPIYPEAPLYDDTEKLRGFRDDEIVMCGHAALALGAAFDTSREDLNVYWDWLNEQGGIHGRRVTMTWEDDAYVAEQAITAAETCAGRSPFVIHGGIGFDQIPGVRDWAEQNRELYFHHIAIEPAQTYNYSFSPMPTVQQVGAEFGRYIAANHGDRTIGIMWRDRPNWSPGSDAGREVLQAAGVEIAADHPVFQNQGVYTQELADMQAKGVDVVWLWENALLAAQVINQANDQDYHPTWVVFPFQTTLDLLNNPQAETIDGVAAWPAYAPGGYGGAHADFGVDPEIARFEAAYAKYRPETTPNDILWQVWVGNKVFHQMLLDCGADCNRNRFAGMLLSGYRRHVKPGCELNFGDPRSLGGHHGGFSYFSQRLFFQGSDPYYESTRYCVPTLG